MEQKISVKFSVKPSDIPNMNIFILDRDIRKCAQYHCDRHVVKMLTEYAQQISTANRVIHGTQIEIESVDKNGKIRKKKHWKLENPVLEETLMKVSHINHPCNKWIRESDSNYKYLRSLGLALYDEYLYRYDKPIHKGGEAVRAAPESLKIEDLGLTPFPNCTQGPARDIDDIVEAYRKFYHTHKSHFATWEKTRSKPDWYVL